MKTCEKCNCPLTLLRRNKMQTESRKLCARCLDAEAQRKVYRAPKTTKPAVESDLDRIARFMGGTDADSPTAPTGTG